MITIRLKEYDGYYIARERFCYTVRKEWQTNAGKIRDRVLGTFSELELALIFIDKSVTIEAKTSINQETFTAIDLLKLARDLGISDKVSSPIIDTYIDQLRALWSDELSPMMPKFKEKIKQLNKDIRTSSRVILDFPDVFIYTSLDVQSGADVFNIHLKNYTYDENGTRRLEDRWSRYYGDLMKAVKRRIEFEVLGKLTGQTIDLQTYIATKKSYVLALCDRVTKLG